VKWSNLKPFNLPATGNIFTGAVTVKKKFANLPAITGKSTLKNLARINILFYFQLHCKGDKHQQVIMSDEGKTWRFRQPPRRVGSEVYKLCLPFLQEGCCLLGNQCTDAHSENELSEWKEHFEFRQNKAQKASKLYKSFNDTLLERLTSNVNVENVS
jgi:hypothetical protein